MELTLTEDNLASSGVTEYILSNDSNDSDDDNTTDNMDLYHTAFMGERQREHGYDDLDERYDGEDKEEREIKWTIGKRRAKVGRSKVNVNRFWDIFGKGNRMVQDENISVKRHINKTTSAWDPIIKK